jgi:hypothetical protein
VLEVGISRWGDPRELTTIGLPGYFRPRICGGVAAVGRPLSGLPGGRGAPTFDLRCLGPPRPSGKLNWSSIRPSAAWHALRRRASCPVAPNASRGAQTETVRAAGDKAGTISERRAVKPTALGTRNVQGLEHGRPAIAYPHPQAAIRPQAAAGHPPLAPARARAATPPPYSKPPRSPAEPPRPQPGCCKLVNV